MKLKAYITVDGLERVALNTPLYSWHLGVMPEGTDIPSDAKLLVEFDVALPTPEACIQPVLDKLAKREQEIQAEAYKDVLELHVRKANLLSLPYNAPKDVA